jgi:hypothetical protein
MMVHMNSSLCKDCSDMSCTNFVTDGKKTITITITIIAKVHQIHSSVFSDNTHIALKHFAASLIFRAAFSMR